MDMRSVRFIIILALLSLWALGGVQAQDYPAGDYELEGTTLKVWRNAKTTEVDFTKDSKLKDVKAIAGSAFAGCPLLEQVVLPYSLSTIAKSAFLNCAKLTSIVLPSSVEEVSADSFNGCTGLKDVLVHPSNEKYKSVDGVLYTKDLKSLEFIPSAKAGELTLPRGLEAIKDNSSKSTQLVSLSIPATVSKIGSAAFQGSKKLAAILIPDAVGNLLGGITNLTEALKVLSIPRGTLEQPAYNAFQFSCLEGSFNTIMMPFDKVIKFDDGWSLIRSEKSQCRLLVKQAHVDGYKKEGAWKSFQVGAVPDFKVSIPANREGTVRVYRMDKTPAEEVQNDAQLPGGTQVRIEAVAKGNRGTKRISCGKYSGSGRELIARIEEASTITAEFADPTITLQEMQHGTVEIAVNGKVTAAGSPIAKGTSVTLTAKAEPGYECDFILVGAQGAAEMSLGYVLEESVSVYAHFKPSAKVLHEVPIRVVTREGSTKTPVVGASVEAGSIRQFTNDQGKATLQLSDGTHSIIVKKDGVGEKTISVTVSGAALSETEVVFAVKLIEVKFKCVDSETKAKVEGASLVLGIKVENPDSEGVFTLNLPDKTYSLEFKAPGYKDKDYSLTLPLAPGTVQPILVEMEQETYAVTIRCMNRDNGAKVAGAKVVVQGQAERVSDPSTGEVFYQLPKGECGFTVSHDSFKDYSGTITVEDKAVVAEARLESKLPPSYVVTFNVHDADDFAVKLNQAIITLGSGKTYSTNAGGVATLELPAAAYTYSVALKDYEKAEGNFTVRDADLPVEVAMRKASKPAPTVELTFVVTKLGKALAGASVSVEGKTVKTNGEGKASFTVGQNKRYAYSCRAEGCVDASGTVDVETLAMDYPVQMTPIGGAAVELVEGGLRVYPNPTRGELRVEGIADGTQLTIYTLEGSVVVRVTLRGGQVDLRMLPAGSYILRAGGRSQGFVKE